MGEPPILDYRTPPKDPRAEGRAARVVGWTVGLMLAGLLLLSIFIPALGRAGPRAHRVKCGSNLRQIGQGIAMYQYDYRVWPKSFEQVLMGVDLDPACFICPASDLDPATGPTTQAVAAKLSDPTHCSYVYFPPPPDARGVHPETVIAVERSGSHQGQGMNVLFADGHVEWFERPEGKRLWTELQAGHNPPRWLTTQPAPSSMPGTGGSR